MFLILVNYRNSLALLNYFFVKNLHYLRLKKKTLLSHNVSLFFHFGFIFLYKLQTSTLMLRVRFNSKPVVNKLTLFLRNSNKVTFSKGAFLRITSLAPSLVFLVLRNHRQLVTAESFLHVKGIRVTGFVT